MNFSLINKFIFSIIFLFFLTSCNTKSVYEKIKIKKYVAPVVDSFDESNIELNNSFNKELNLDNKVLLKNFKNNNKFLNNVIIDNDKIFSLINNKLYTYSYQTGELISLKELKIGLSENDSIISLDYIDNTFVIALKSGSIFRTNLNGQLIWSYNYKKLLNTPLTILNDQIIILYADEIKSILLKNGSDVWFSNFEDLPIYQAKGGQLDNFLNIIYFILPNNKVGSIDYNLGNIHKSKLDSIPLISSINNTKDKIYIYKNYLLYLDEGRYLYTLDIFKDEFVVFKENINSASSNIFYNNSLILKEGNYLQAVNITNSKTFWLINDEKISKNSSIIAIRNFKKNIEIFLNNGDILSINNKKLIKIHNLGIGKVNKITFDKQNIIAHTNSNKTIIF